MKITRLHLRHKELETRWGEILWSQESGFQQALHTILMGAKLRTSAWELTVWVKREGILGNISSTIESLIMQLPISLAHKLTPIMQKVEDDRGCYSRWREYEKQAFKGNELRDCAQGPCPQVLGFSVPNPKAGKQAIGFRGEVGSPKKGRGVHAIGHCTLDKSCNNVG